MPGRHVTDRPVRLYMSFRRTDSPVVAAAKAGFSMAIAYRIEPGATAGPKAPRGRGRLATRATIKTTANQTSRDNQPEEIACHSDDQP